MMQYVAFGHFMKRSLELLLSLAFLSALPVVAPAQVVISEFMADNKTTLADEDREFSDWIEIYNTGSTTVNLAGWSLTDDETRQARWFFPATNIVAKGFMVIFASGKDRSTPGAPLHTDFALKASGEYLALVKPDGSVATEFAPSFPPQTADFSYGLAQDVVTNTLIASGAGARVLVPANGSLGLTWTQPGFADSGWLSGPTGVGYETAVPGFAVYNYLANVGSCDLQAAQDVISNPSQQAAVFSENAPVINYFNTGGSSHYDNERTFPGLTINVDQDNFVIDATATITIPSAGNWTFGVNSDDGFSLDIGSFNVSYPDPRGPGDTLQTFYFPAAGDYPLHLVFYECGGGAEVELWAAQGSFSAWDSGNFRLVGDILNGGLAVISPPVSGGGGGGGLSYRSLINTDVQTYMSGVNASAYVRVPFTVADAASLQSLSLLMKYDDGFAAWLNGQFLCSRNAPASPQWSSTATAAHPNVQASVFEEINVSDHLNAIQTGNNVLAIQGLNSSATDSDFLVLPELTEYKATTTALQFFATPTPGALNSKGLVAFVADTKFSVDRGFFTNAFSLSITSATPNATIVYTLDGTEPSLTNGTVYSSPLTISKTTVVRAAAFRDGYFPANVDTQTYLFLNDVLQQSPNGETPSGWPSSWGANVVDYGMDPNIVNSPTYSGEMITALTSIPTFSIVTDLKNLFDPTTGIYANPGQDGIGWERPASVELVYPDGAKGFQIDAGIRIRGGYSRSTGNPKHAFRLFFRQEYGDSKLHFPLFASQNGVEDFDCFDLRTFQNYSWSFEGDYRCIGLRDQFSRDTEYDQGQPTERGDLYHLYINGQYWGVFNTDERPEASYGESYFGGNKEDYDVIKVDTGAGYTIFATDGDMNAWTRLWRAATNGFANDADYFKIQGLNVDGTPNPSYENLLDVDNLIDYMLVTFFSGNLDAPVSAFLGDQNPNNIYAVRNRTGLYGGFRFIQHDGEHTLHHESSLGGNELYRDRTGPFPAGDPLQQGAAAALARSNPQYLFTRLAENAEFRLRVADHVQREFFNGGVLTTEACRARLTVRSNEIYHAMVAESARWGDSKREPPRTRDVDWETEMNRVWGDYFAQRPGIVLAQLQNKGWYPSVAAPSFNQFGGNVTNGFRLVISAPAGTIYYTRDGSDPRLRGGAVSPAALVYSSPITLTQSASCRARVLSGGIWSALTAADFYVIQNFTELLVTEIMYHPPDSLTVDGNEYEFIELKNVSSQSLELSGVHFTNGINYTFPIGKFVAPGQFVVLASNPSAFTNKYPGVHVDGTYTGKLSNSGENLALAHVSGAPIFALNYGTRPPWPETPDGYGFSLVPTDPNYNPDPANPVNWRASTSIGGSPGADDPPSSVPRILVNEALTHTDLPQLDSVELYNPNTTNVNIGNWYLTDDRTVPKKFGIPAGTTIPAHGYIVFTEADWNNPANGTNQFRLDSHGEVIYLYSADGDGNLTGYSDGFAFGAAQNGVSFGRYTNSVGEIQYPAQVVNTLGGPNAGPRVGPLVINEIQYHPAPGGDEFIELKSLTNGVLRLYDPLFPTNTWRVNGVGFDFPQGVQIAPDGLLLVVGTDPAAFRSKYGVPTSVPIYGPYPGALQGNGESLALQCPDHPDVDTNTGAIYIPHIDVDVVRYGDTAPWPAEADGLGPSLERLAADAYGNDPINWRASPGAPSPGYENTGNHPPYVNAGLNQTISATDSPVPVVLNGIATDDGLPEPLTTHWYQISGPGSVWFDDPAQTNTTAWFPGIGSYTLRLGATDGAIYVSHDVTITIQHPLSPLALTLVSKGSTWKYLDNGSDQGAAWRARSFNDSAWPSGPAPLGYGDANGQLPATPISYGPDANHKYITTYYRHTFSVSDPGSVASLVVGVQRDDGVVVYLNGAGIFTNNMPTDVAIDYLTTAVNAVGGSDETMFYSTSVNPSLLVSGNNVLAAEIHQANATSSDTIFDLELTGEGYPPNQGPSVDAGSDEVVDLPSAATLNGVVQDDGLPLPPGLLTVGWSKVSGPGTVAFADSAVPSTTATFAAAGTYILRLSADDGASFTSDDTTVTVNAEPLPLVIDSVTISGTPPVFRLRFTAQAGASYQVQYRETMDTDSWMTLTNLPTQSVTQSIEVTDPAISNLARYYRLMRL